MIVDSSEMFEDFIAVVAAVAEFAGLPAHNFEYDSSNEFKGGDCEDDEGGEGNGYFADGGRFVHKKLAIPRLCASIISAYLLELETFGVGSK